MKVAAKRVGLSLDEYQRQIGRGLKWCTGCKEWHAVNAFSVDRSRGDGRRARCLDSERGKPRAARDPIHERARKRVAYLIRRGILPHPNTQPCADCGHVWVAGERRHEHDHHRGYEPPHDVSVEVVCTLCHADREKDRRHG